MTNLKAGLQEMMAAKQHDRDASKALDEVTASRRLREVEGNLIITDAEIVELARLPFSLRLERFQKKHRDDVCRRCKKLFASIITSRYSESRSKTEQRY